MLAVLFLVAAWPSRAYACAVCNAGDRTLAPSGTEQPFEARVRALVDARMGMVTTGDGDARIAVYDHRLELGVSYAPHDDLLFSAGVPVLTRTIETASLPSETLTSLGDVELRAQKIIWERRGASIQRVALGVIARLPTSPLEHDARGAPLPSPLEPGCGAITTAVGARYAWTRGMWSADAGLWVYVPFAVRDDPHPGDSIRAGATVQVQPVRAIAARVGAATRVEGSGEYQNQDEPNTGGLVTYATADLSTSPATDLVITAGALVPVVQDFRGAHREGPIVALSVAYDF